MITAQEIREKTFDNATFGGYDKTQVDDYLDELAEAANASQRELGSIRGKMKVLVSKIDEYSASEDAMQKALLSAQKLANQIESDAQEKAEQILAQAQAQADELIASANAQAEAVLGDLIHLRAEEERRLQLAQEACTNYLQEANNQLARHQEFLNSISTLPEELLFAEAPAIVEEFTPVAAEPAVEEIAPVEEAPVEALPIYEEETQPLSAYEESFAEEVPAIPETDDEVDEPTRSFRF